MGRKCRSPGRNDGQPRFSRDAMRRVRVPLEPLRRHPGPLERGEGERRHQIRHEYSSGSFSGYFRDDNFNAADFLAKRVLPYSNQQLSGTFGGPIRRDRLHYFANYEYEREPGPPPQYSRTRTSTSSHRTRRKRGAAAGRSVLAAHAPMLRGNCFHFPGTRTMQSTGRQQAGPRRRGKVQAATQFLATLTQVLSNRVLNEIRVGLRLHYYPTGNYTLRQDTRRP